MTISLANQMKRIPCIREKTQIKKPLHYAEAFHLSQTYNVFRDYPPKLSYMIEDGSTPRLSSMLTTAFDIGPGPHM